MTRGMHRPTRDTTLRAKALRESDRERWYRQAYRQGVDKDSWAIAKSVEGRTQIALEFMPDRAEGHYFKDPHGKYRELGPTQRERPEIMTHRMAAVDLWLGNLPRKGATRYADLADLDADFPHPGEDEQVAIWMEEARMFDRNADYFGTELTTPANESAVLLAKAPIILPRSTMTDAPPTEAIPPAHLRSSDRGRGGSTTSGSLPPFPRPLTTQEMAGRNAEAEARSNILAFQPGSSSSDFAMPRVNNFDSPKRPLYPPTPGILDPSRIATMLGISPEKARDMPWVWLDNKLREHDSYSPLDNIVPMKDRPFRSHPRAPEAAAQDAIDIVHEIHLAKGRDWNQVLPSHPQAAKAEFQNALDATVTEAATIWIGRKQSIPLAHEIERIRQYLAPRLVKYFPEEMQVRLLQEETQSTTIPRIKEGPQGARELITALVFGEIREVTINGEKVDLENQAQSQPTALVNSRTGSWGSRDVQHLNYLLGQNLTKYLKECDEISQADIVGGPTTPQPDGSFTGPPEAFFQNPFNPGTKGSARTDMAIRIQYGNQECIFHINTVDVTGKGALTARELRNLLRAIAHSGAIRSNWQEAEGRWGETLIKKRRMASNNTFTTVEKPGDKTEAELQKAIEDFLSRLTCAKIIAACKEGNGLIDASTKSDHSPFEP